MKKVVFIGGVFAKENEGEILANAKKPVEYSANVFQKKMIAGFRALESDSLSFRVLSAPFIGSFPNACKKFSFKGFQEKQSEYDYVNFNNLWGYRNVSRTRALKKALKSYVKDGADEKTLIVYSPHTPFLEAAVWAKKKDPKIKICLVVPDLPQYMNLSAKKSLLYRVAKSFDIKKFNKLNRQVDSYVLLTEGMKESIDTHGKPCRIVEGIVTEDELANGATLRAQAVKDESVKTVVYTGKVYERFGSKGLIDAFRMLTEENYRLVICGDGDGAEYVKAAAKEDSRICFLGQVPAATAKEWTFKADVLVNPRRNDEEYTKYSFPSKNIEYLLSGNPVVAYKLDGMPDVYKDMMRLIVENDGRGLTEAFAEEIRLALTNDYSNAKFVEYAKARLSAKNIAEDILKE